ncbi:MAG: PhzF family phenazine biosynthesis protein [Cyanobacteria bacterium]|nr:PhzF family phenazine biosynthesis protein [Cyanobacteriota bacterium]
MRYQHYDVFTDTMFEGNQLAVFEDARGLSSAQMQAITREMNFSECTFLLPVEAAGTDIRMRIFTPGRELPMAGHPVIGSTFALADLGVIKKGQASFVFGLNVGPTRVELTWEGDRLSFAWMDQRTPEFREPVSPRPAIIRSVGLDPSAVDATGLPIEEVSCGNAFVLVPVKTREAVDAADADVPAMKKLQSAFPGGHVGVLFFTMDTRDPNVTVYSRMFAPSAGIVEDPATGSAAGPLGSYLVKHGLVHRNEMRDMVNLQGAVMGRPSRLHMRIEEEEGAISRVQAGGQSVLVGSGQINLRG